MKIQRAVWVDKDLWNLAQKKKINCSQVISQSLEIILGVQQSKKQILNEIEEKKQEVVALEVKLQQIKVKQGMSLSEYIEIINENNNYSDNKKQEIKHYILKSVELIRDDITYALGRAMLITKKYGLEITPKMLIRFSNMSGQEKKECTCEIPPQHRKDLIGQLCGKCLGIIQQKRHISYTENKTVSIIDELKQEFAQKREAQQNE